MEDLTHGYKKPCIVDVKVSVHLPNSFSLHKGSKDLAFVIPRWVRGHGMMVHLRSTLTSACEFYSL